MLAEKILCRDTNTEVRLFGADGQPKTLWAENRLGRALRMLLGREVRWAGITGNEALKFTSHNLITNIGHAATAGRLSGQGTYNTFVNIAIGTGATAPAVTDTALGAEITTNGGARGAAAASQTTTTVANDSMQLVKTFSFTGPFAITEEGIFDSATVGGNMLARQTFAAINVASGDSLQITHTVTA